MVVLAFAENSIQLVPDGTLFVHIAVILVMVVVLNVTLFKPINRILEEREERTRGRLSQAQQILADVGAKVSQYEQGLREARSEGYRLLEQERAIGLGERESRIARLKEEVTGWAAAERAAINRQVGEAQLGLEQEARAFAGEIASRILGRAMR